MENSSYRKFLHLLEEGCVSSQALEQITKPLVKQVLQVLKKENAVKTNSSLQPAEKLLDSTQYLVRHNKNSFFHLKDIGFLDVIEVILHDIVQRTEQDTVSDEMLSLIELTTETVLAISDVGAQAKVYVVLQLLPGILEFLQNQQLTFLNRLEILKTINSLLEQCPLQTKEEFLNSTDNQQKIQSLVDLTQTIGDFEFQVGAVECLMRLFPRKARQHYAELFITDSCMLQGFMDIKDKDFETDCRQFLNVINAKSEDPNQGVYSIPCLYAFIGKKELLKPSDMNYNEFWVDFNIGSQRLTIFCEQNSLMSQNSNVDDDLWETVAIYKSDVQNCSCHVEGDGVILLEIYLKSPVCDIYPSQHQDIRDNKIQIQFDGSLEMHVTHAVTHTFSVTERVNKVSTVKNPLQISLREVQETDSQSVVSVPNLAPRKMHGTWDTCSQDSSSVRRHKVSVPSIPMASPISMKSGNSASSHQLNKDQKNTVKTSVTGLRSAESKQHDNQFQKPTIKPHIKTSKTAEFSVPKTPTIQRPKSKVKTPVVVVNPSSGRNQAKTKNTNKLKDKVGKPAEDPADDDIIIPDSNPVDKEVEIVAKYDQKPKVSTSFRQTDDSGIGADISATSVTETALLNQAGTELSQTSIQNEKAENTHDKEKVKVGSPSPSVPDIENSSNDAILELVDNLATSELVYSQKMKKKKKENFEKIQSALSNSFGFDADVDSIPDSSENVDTTRRNNQSKVQTRTDKSQPKDKKGKTRYKKKKNTKKASEIETAAKNEKLDQIKMSSKETGLLSVIKDNESLKELYDFVKHEKLQNTTIKVNDKSPSTKESKNVNESTKERSGHTEQEKKRKQKLQIRDEQNFIDQENNETKLNQSKVSDKLESCLPTRKSARSKTKKINYNEQDDKYAYKTEDKIDMSHVKPYGREMKKEKKANTLTEDKGLSPKQNTSTRANPADHTFSNREDTNQSDDSPSETVAALKNKRDKNELRSKKNNRKSKSESMKKYKSSNVCKDQANLNEDKSEITDDLDKSDRAVADIEVGKNNMEYDDDNDIDLLIEEDDSYNARRYRQEVSIFSTSYTEGKKSSKHQPDYSTTTNLSKTGKSEKDGWNGKSSEKHEKDDVQTSKNKKKNQTDDMVDENVCVAYKGRVGFSDFNSVNDGPNQSMMTAQSKSMVFQMSYSKTKTSYRSFDWAAELPVKRETGYDPYDFEAQCDSASMASERNRRKNLSRELNNMHNVSFCTNKTSKKNEKTAKPKKRGTSNRHLQTDGILQDVTRHYDGKDEEERENNLLFQDKSSNKWYRKSSYKQPVKNEETTQVKPCSKSDDDCTDDDVYIHRDDEQQVDSDGFFGQNKVKDFAAIFRDKEKKSSHGKETRRHSSFLATPKTLAAMVDDVCGTDYSFDLQTSKTPNVVTPVLCSGSARRRGYKPLNISVIKTPQSATLTDKQDTESDDEAGAKPIQAAKRPQRQRKIAKKKETSESDAGDEQQGKSYLSSSSLENSLNTTRKSEKSWIAEQKQKPDRRNEKKASKTYIRQKSSKQPKISSEEESEEEEECNENMEICSIPMQSIARSVELESVTPSYRKSFHSDVVLDDLILSPVTPFRPATEEDDIQVVQTQENYAMSLNMNETLDYDEYSRNMDKGLKGFQRMLGDSGFASGPSSERRPTKSALKRKFPDVEESEESEQNLDELSEEDEAERSTFVPKKLFKSEENSVFQVSVKTPKTVSIYSDNTEEADFGFGCDTGLASFLTAFGADIQKQFKKRKQCLETITKDTLRTTQQQFDQAWAQQHQQQSSLHKEFMSRTMLELNELTKDIEMLKEAEKKTEEFFQYQLKVLRANEQAQRIRMERMRQTNTCFKDTLGKIKKNEQKVQVNMKDQLKKIMGNMQQKLLQDVQKQELMNVRRGLQNLF